MSLTEIDKQKQQEFKAKRSESAEEILKVKDSVLMDKSQLFYGVLSIDKKDPKNKKYYAVMPKDNKYLCDCFDFARWLETIKDHECKHIIALKKRLQVNKKLKIADLENLLKTESL